MRTGFLAIAGILFLMFLFSACRNQDSTQSQDTPESGVMKTASSEDLKNFVDKYMDAMLAMERSDTLFAKDCVFIENGVRLLLGEEGLYSSIVGKDTYMFYVPDVETRQIA